MAGARSRADADDAGEFDAFIKSEIATQAALAKAAGLETELIGNEGEDGMKRLTALTAVGARLAVGGTAPAQDKYPSKPVKIIVPYAPAARPTSPSASSASRSGRILGQRLRDREQAGRVRRARHRGNGARAARRLHDARSAMSRPMRLPR